MEALWINLPPAVAAILVAVVAGTFGLVAYTLQKWLERRAEIARKRQEVYSDLLRAFVRMAKDDPDARDAFAGARSDVMLYASDAVVQKVAVLSRIVNVTDRREIESRGQDFAAKTLRAYGELVDAMRKDVISEARLSPDALALAAPFK